MRDDTIKKVEIKDDGRLCVWPSNVQFEYIYRSSMEVHWDIEERYLYGPKPREWSYLDWFTRIVTAAMFEYEVRLKTNHKTKWINIESHLMSEIVSYQDQY